LIFESGRENQGENDRKIFIFRSAVACSRWSEHVARREKWKFDSRTHISHTPNLHLGGKTPNFTPPTHILRIETDLTSEKTEISLRGGMFEMV